MRIVPICGGHCLNLINEFDTGYLAFMYSIHAVDHPSQSTDFFLMRKGLDLVFVKKPLRNLEPVLRKFPIFSLCVSFVGSLPIDRLIEHGEGNDPVWLNASTCMASDRKGIET